MNMALYKKIQITETFLNNDKNTYFVFGDNLIKQGYGGAAILRDHPRAIGFITKKYPDNCDNSFYQPTEYSKVFFEELHKLKVNIANNPNKMFYVSQLGAGLANKFYIWEKLIHHNLVKELQDFKNVIFCWEENLNK
jgi:hypothetical protein